MRPLTEIGSPAWAHAPLSQVWKLPEHTAAYVAPPRMALVQAATQFGRLEHRHGPLALLVTVTFHNDGAHHIRLRSLAMKYGGAWYHPIQFLGDRVHLWYAHGHHDLALPRTQNLIAAPYIPAAAAVERGALFRNTHLSALDMIPVSGRLPLAVRLLCRGRHLAVAGPSAGGVDPQQRGVLRRPLWCQWIIDAEGQPSRLAALAAREPTQENMEMPQLLTCFASRRLTRANRRPALGGLPTARTHRHRRRRALSLLHVWGRGPLLLGATLLWTLAASLPVHAAEFSCGSGAGGNVS
jgi:hypothetical protein